jgi:hypothetical protein
MKRAYRVLHRNDSQGLAGFLALEASGLLPIVELIQRTEMAVDELIDAAGRSAGVDSPIRDHYQAYYTF